MRRKLLATGAAGAAVAVPAVALAQTPDVTADSQMPDQVNLVHLVRADAAHKARTAVAREEHLRTLTARRRARRQAAATTAPAATASPQLQAIAQCESGGNPTSEDGQFHGKYQFDYATWASVGGTGNPAQAPESEQDQRAQMLLNREGTTPWPVCGRGA